MCFSVHAHLLRFFIVLNQRLRLPKGARRSLELLYQIAWDLDHWKTWIPPLLASVRATGSLTHIQLSGGALDGWIWIWAEGSPETGYENAKLSFSMNWSVYLCPKQLRGIFKPPLSISPHCATF